jgi:hypothetical protein
MPRWKASCSARSSSTSWWPWGGDSTIRSAREYIGPGFELVAFDPKTSISLIGREAFESDAVLADAADRAAADATIMNQQACASSRVQYVEGSVEQVDRYCALLQARLGVRAHTTSACGNPLPSDLRDEIDGLRDMEPHYRVWGGYEGKGLVIRSEEPVDFHPGRPGRQRGAGRQPRGSREARQRGDADGGCFRPRARPICATRSPLPACSAWWRWATP